MCFCQHLSKHRMQVPPSGSWERRWGRSKSSDLGMEGEVKCECLSFSSFILSWKKQEEKSLRGFK